tara:strand:+ start:18879 stop:20003 length:1125 start_codon:yes stop_codon:yes gene_type:complete
MKLLIISFLSSILLASCSTINDQLKDIGLKAPEKESNDFHIAWSKNLDPEYFTGNLPIGLQSPIIHEGIVYIGKNTGVMNAFDLDNGRLIWQVKDNAGYHDRPVVYEDKLIYGTIEGRVYSRDLKTGKLAYSVDLGSAVETQGSIYKGRLFLHTRNHKLFALDALTGKILWAYKRSIPFLTTLQRASKPIVNRNRLIVGFADGNVCAFNFETGVLLWESKIVDAKRFVDVDAKPVIFQGKIVIGSLAGPLTVINPKNGLILRRIPYSVGRGLVVKGKTLLAGTTDGELLEIDRNFKVIKSNKVSKYGISSFVDWKGQLAVSSVGGEILIVNPDTFKLEKSKHLGHVNSAIFGELQSFEDNLAVFSSRNRLYLVR